MSNIPVPQARYELLKDESRARFTAKKKFCCISTVILLTIAFIGMVLLVVNLQYFINGFSLPEYYQSKEFPALWVERAIKYNSLNWSEGSVPEHVTKGRKSDTPNSSGAYKLVCYYSMPDLSDENYLAVDKIDPYLCTHINVGFVSIMNNVLHITPAINKTLAGAAALKQTNRNLKVLVSVGGGASDAGFPNMVFNHTSRKQFIRSVVATIRQLRLDGVDLDWEFPGEEPHGDRRQRMHFTQLLRELREEIGRHSARRRFLLSVAVAAPATLADSAYDVPYLSEFADYVNLMAYDYHFYTRLTPQTGLNAPLYRREAEAGLLATLNVNHSVQHWLARGLARHKLVLGLPTYGHSFQLQNPDNAELGAPARGYGRLGSAGFVDACDVRWFLARPQTRAVFDTEAKCPYASRGDQWLSFDDAHSLAYKAELVRACGLAGAMVLSLNADDHRGGCGGPRAPAFPLTRAVRGALRDDQL